MLFLNMSVDFIDTFYLFQVSKIFHILCFVRDINKNDDLTRYVLFLASKYRFYFLIVTTKDAFKLICDFFQL